MATWVALLRGINVGTAHRVAMAELRTLLGDELGFDDVRTLLNSGNVVFAAGGSAAAHEKTLATELEAHFGFPIPTVVRSAASVRSALERNPFAGAPEKELHIVFVSAKPPLPAPDAIAPDELSWSAKDRVVHLRVRNGLAGSKIGDLGKAGDVVATSRSVATVTKLVELADRP